MTQEELIKHIKWERKQPGGGQQVSVVPSDVILAVNELGIKIEVGYHRSMLKNKEDAYNMLLSFCNDNKIIDE